MEGWQLFLLKKIVFAILIIGISRVAVANDTIVVSYDELESAGENVKTAEIKSSGNSAAASWQDDSFDEIVIGEDEISHASNVQRGEQPETVIRRRFWLPTGVNLPSLNFSPKIDIDLPDVKIKFPSYSHKTVYSSTTYVNRRYVPGWHYYRGVPRHRLHPHHRFHPRRPVPPRFGPLRPHLKHPLPGKSKFKMPGKPGPRPSKVVPPKHKSKFNSSKKGKTT